MPSEPQLALWLNTEVHPPLPRTVRLIDHDFSNGYLLGHLCARLAPQLAFPTPLDSSFTTALHDADTPGTKLANFGQVMGLLNSVGIRMSMEDVDAVATEQRGAATALLLRIKDVLDLKQRRSAVAAATSGGGKAGATTVSPASPSRGMCIKHLCFAFCWLPSCPTLSCTALILTAHPHMSCADVGVTGDASGRLGESFREKQSRKLESMTFAERLVASGMGIKQAAMELHLEKFETRRVHREKEVRATCSMLYT